MSVVALILVVLGTVACVPTLVHGSPLPDDPFLIGLPEEVVIPKTTTAFNW